MYTLVRSIPIRQLVLEQAPAIGTSLVVAEMYYKFHSFLLEAIAFLGTWYAIDAGIGFVKSRFKS